MVMAWPIRPPVDDSAVASRQPAARSSSPSRRAAAARSSSSGAGIGPSPGSAIVLELQRHRVVQSAQVADDGLQLVPALADDPHRVALDGGLHLGEVLADDLAELLRLLACQSPAQRDVLTHGPASRGLELAPVEDLERQAAPHGLGLDQVLDRAGPILVVGLQRDVALAELQRDLGTLEVVAGRNLAPDLVKRVHQLLLVEVADDVERSVGHAFLLSPILPATGA